MVDVRPEGHGDVIREKLKRDREENRGRDPRRCRDREDLICQPPEVWIVWGIGYRDDKPLSGLDFLHVGEQLVVGEITRRQHDHRTMNEVGQELRALRIQITDREVERLWDYYRLLLRGLTQTDLVKLRDAEKTYGGLVWSADGLQPESGQPQLWVVREVLTRTVVRAEWLCQVDESTLKKFLQPVKALGLKALATVSDQQLALVKALQATWRKPHQACQSHFLRDAAVPLVEQDRARMVEIKAKLRGIRAIERQIEAAPPTDRSAIIVGTYALAIRQGLHFRSRAPLQLGGVRLYALLDEQTRSMQRCLKKGAMRVSPSCSTWCNLCGINFVCRC